MAALSDPYPWQEPVSKPARGAFIVIEGLDRAGKTTQVKRLCDKLYAQGHNIKTIRFPGIYPFLIFQFLFGHLFVLISAEVSHTFIVQNHLSDMYTSLYIC
jgi:GTPase SAR1 family protein